MPSCCGRSGHNPTLQTGHPLSQLLDKLRFSTYPPPTVELVLDDANASRFTQKRRRDSDNLTPRRGTEFNATPPPTTMGDRGTPPRNSEIPRKYETREIPNILTKTRNLRNTKLAKFRILTKRRNSRNNNIRNSEFRTV